MKISKAWLLLVIALVLSTSCSTTKEPIQSSIPSLDKLYEEAAKPLSERDWQAYRAHSARLRKLDQTFMQKELGTLGKDEPIKPPRAKRFGFKPGQPTRYYQTAEGKRIAEIILSFQTPSGGWSKRTNMSDHRRQPGEAFGVEERYIPTFDNLATSTQIWELTRAFDATGDTRYSDAVIRALKLILLAQHPSGGWPQSFPLTGGYHDDITYNDEVMSNLIRVVHAASEGSQGMDFIPDDLRHQAALSYARAIEAILATQVEVNGQPTIWGAQHDPHTLLPTAARAFEPVALATQESAKLVNFLMRIEQPSEGLKRAITNAVQWFEANRIYGQEWVEPKADESRLQPNPNAGPLWARFVEIGTNRAVFGDRDGKVYYAVDDISRERQMGYAWYTDAPLMVLKKYDHWVTKHRPPRH